MNLDGTRILVTGGGGFLGRNLIATLIDRGASPFYFSSNDYDLTKPSHAQMMMDKMKPEIVIHAAARVGGILANKRKPYTFGRDNLLMGINVIDACIRNQVQKVVLIGTTCSYPSECEVPFREDWMWDGHAEETNSSYGHAKRLLGDLLASAVQEGRLQCATTAILANLYGPGDNFNPETSHVIPAMIRRFSYAMLNGHQKVECWGTGHPTRDFLHVRDAAEGIIQVCERWHDPRPINIGTGVEYSIGQVARLIAEIVGYKGAILWDHNLDGQKRRALCTRRAWESLKWEPQINLRQGLEETVEYFLENRQELSNQR